MIYTHNINIYHKHQTYKSGIAASISAERKERRNQKEIKEAQRKKSRKQKKEQHSNISSDNSESDSDLDFTPPTSPIARSGNRRKKGNKATSSTKPSALTSMSPPLKLTTTQLPTIVEISTENDELYQSLFAPDPSRMVHVTGAKGINADFINGWFIATSSGSNGRVNNFKSSDSMVSPGVSPLPIFVRHDNLVVMEYFAPRKKWHIKAAASRGTSKVIDTLYIVDIYLYTIYRIYCRHLFIHYRHLHMHYSSQTPTY